MAKHFTQVNYAQGLFVHLTNKRWLNKLSEELQKILIEVVAEESAEAWEATKKTRE